MNEIETKEKKQVLELIISYEKKTLEKGWKEGVERRLRKDGNKKNATSRKKCLPKDMDIQAIHELTELSLEEIEKLR
ncbi:hypothetical protein AT864_03412 [Anoxybacillus sp. P3H1B]|nr:hypothetical protein AT864_03412 [Anoxybacillus sp. P3H1B]